MAHVLLTLLLTYLIWTDKIFEWIGTIAISSFAILADTLSVLDLLAILGIPKLVDFGEILFSVMVIASLLKPHLRYEYGI